MNRHLLNGLATSFVVGVTGSALWLAHVIQLPEQPLKRQLAQHSGATSPTTASSTADAPTTPQAVLIAQQRR